MFCIYTETQNTCDSYKLNTNRISVLNYFYFKNIPTLENLHP